jgi:polyhydroxyalkanoate synthesis repressor PhaR
MARLIKRYENRKLYDTTASQYVSLSDIADLVRDGATVRVVDNGTGRDLTAQTLTQIILEEGRDGKTAIPSDILHDLLRRSEAALDSGLDQIRTTVDDLVQGSVGRLKKLLQRPRSHELDELQAQLRTLEQQLSTLLDDLDERRRVERVPAPSPNGTAEEADAAPVEPTDEKVDEASSSSPA